MPNEESQGMNFYEEERYPLSIIIDFVTGERRLYKASPLTLAEAKEEEISFNGPLLSGREGPIDLLFRFSDDDVHTPALGFRKLPDLSEGGHPQYQLVVLDPSIEQSWERAMNREREEPWYIPPGWKNL